MLSVHIYLKTWLILQVWTSILLYLSERMAEFTASVWHPSPLQYFNTYMNVLFAGLWTFITQNSSQLKWKHCLKMRCVIGFLTLNCSVLLWVCYCLTPNLINLFLESDLSSGVNMHNEHISSTKNVLLLHEFLKVPQIKLEKHSVERSWNTPSLFQL